MADYLEKIEVAWNTSKMYKRRVAILLLSHDRNYTLERICQRSNSGILNEAPLYHISALGKKELKKKGARIASIPANVTEERIAESESILNVVSANTIEPGVFIVDDFLKRLDDRDSAGGHIQTGANRQTFFDLFELTLDVTCDAQVFVFLEHSEKRDLIPDIVDAEIQVVEHPYPSRDEVREIVEKEVRAYKAKANIKIENEDVFVSAISQQLSGFAFSTISWMIRDAFIKHNSATNGTLIPDCTARIVEEIQQIKEAIIGQQLGMTILKSASDKPIGVDKFLSYIEKRRNKICVPGSDRVKGVLLIGPPGTGKSMLAKYLSCHLSKPAIEVRLSSLMSQWMGETEKLFQRLTDVIDAMAPVIIYMDEIEKMFSDEGSGSSAGASMVRATGHLLTWMNDSTSPVFIIATANNVARMGEIGLTMTRRGRFDALFYIGYPGLESRKGLVERYAGKNKLSHEQTSVIASMTQFFSGADINGVLQDAASDGASNFYNNLISAIESHRPRVNAMREMYMANTRGVMRRLAIPAGDCEEEDDARP